MVQRLRGGGRGVRGGVDSESGRGRHSAALALSPGSSVLDLGCGSGVPIARALVGAGDKVVGIDASPTMIAALRERFPGPGAACEPLKSSMFFGRAIEAVVAWGLLFLLRGEARRRFFPRVAAALRTGGRLFFTAPVERCSWKDLSTGRTSRSLGGEACRDLLRASGFELVGEEDDEGENHSFAAIRREAREVPASGRATPLAGRILLLALAAAAGLSCAPPSGWTEPASGIRLVLV